MISFDQPVTVDIVNIMHMFVNLHCRYEGNLEDYVKLVYSEPNIHPGHNGLQHVLHVTSVCYEACEYYNRLDNITSREARNLLIAALFHGYAHLGQPGKDEVNIAAARATLDKHLLEHDREHLDEIVLIIKATQSPHSARGQSMTLLQAIIRDVDQTSEMAGIGGIFNGFGSELDMTPIKILEQQLEFFQRFRYYSDFGRVFLRDEASSDRWSATQHLLGIIGKD